jgi:hypothetical protein
LLLAGDEVCLGEEDGLVVGEIVGDKVGFGEGDGVAVGIGVGVGVGALTKLAVIVPGPLIVATVEESDGISNEMLPVLADHEENV